MSRYTTDEAAAALLAPVAIRLSEAAERLPPGPRVSVTVGEVRGFYALSGDRLTLSSGLVGPDVYHPTEADDLLALDRWRRAVGSVLEGIALAALAASAGREAGPEWFWVGAAVDAADRAAPELGLAAPALARAVSACEPGRWPRSGVAVMRAWRSLGVDPWERTLALIGSELGSDLGSDEWLRLGAEVLDPAARPAGIAAAPDGIVPATLGPWAWRRVVVDGGRTGGRLHLAGGACEPEWIEAGEQRRVMIAAVEVGEVRIVGGGPGGPWVMASGQGFGQMMGARGVEFTFRRSGALEILLADAFVGPLPALEVAERMGTSGVINGRWAVAGPSEVRLFGLVPMGLTVHGREEMPFAVPAPGAGLESYLKELEGSAWRWALEGGRLILRGESFGPTVELRFRRE